jgi:hypothetical protein
VRGPSSNLMHERACGAAARRAAAGAGRLALARARYTSYS